MHTYINQIIIYVEALLYKRKKSVLLIPDEISVEEKLINIINVSVKHGKPKFENYVYHECRNGVNRFFTNNKNINKDIHCILDEGDDNDDNALISDSINFYNHFTTSKVLYDNVNDNNPLNDEEYNHKGDMINSRNYPVINRIKNEYVKKNAKKPLSDKEFCYDFGNDKKYHNIALMKPLLATFLSNQDGDKFCLNCFNNFQKKNYLKSIKNVMLIVTTLSSNTKV